MKVETEHLVDIARNYAYKCHREVNHWYDGRRYEYHLEMAFNEAMEFIHLIPEETRPYILSAVLCHDTFEDCRQSYNDIKKNVGEIVADIVFAVSNEKGKDRNEKQNDKYYHGIRTTPGATFVKLCDRLANTLHSHMTKSTMIKRYRVEYEHFKTQLYEERYKPMFDKLEQIYNNAN